MRLTREGKGGFAFQYYLARRLLCGGPNAASNAIGCAQHYSRSRDAVILVYDDAGNAIETHENAREFKAP